MQIEEIEALYRKEGSRYHRVDDAEIIGQAFTILAKRGMGDLVAQTIRRLFLLTEIQIDHGSTNQEMENAASIISRDLGHNPAGSQDDAGSITRDGGESAYGSSAADR